MEKREARVGNTEGWKVMKVGGKDEVGKGGQKVESWKREKDWHKKRLNRKE